MTTPVQRIYEEISQPSPKSAPRMAKAEPAPISLDHADVRDILRYKRPASIEELQYVIEHAKQFRLSAWERNDLAVRVTIALADRNRPASNPNAKLFAVLDIAETPVGLLHHRSRFERELRATTDAILSCKDHRPPRCRCWYEARVRLWQVQDRYGPDSPEGWVATWIWERLEELELANRPQQLAGLGTILSLIPHEQTAGRNIY